ncbi:AgmX/PglI C-terminal domain-containing protein [Nannocystis punicea]|uniref:AgmX/PglI C-terminal domain-containing protein n=1 Tax=Nannocystis punicea TaxID=2995304 RepID=A0ABY7H3M5_9BACT|nr:AgmX/PglI C-terminal domain-containing protein [Nannocystis poenicansa]WAS93594.1 AgmX/PglI C-terminal domain-containing protein [Nannocystis poenicansa]
MSAPSVTPVVPAVAEVVARYRGRVVDVQHVRWREPPPVTPTAYLGGGAVLLLLGFALALRGLAQVEAAARCELPPCPAPGLGAGLGAFFIAAGLLPLVVGLVRWRDRARARYTVGEAHGADFTVAVPGAPAEGVPLIIALEQGFVLGLPPGVRGTVDGDSPLDLAEAVAQGRRSIALPAGATARLELGELTFEISQVPPADAPRNPIEFDRLTWLSHLGAALLVGGWVVWLDRSPPATLELDHEAQIELAARYITPAPPRDEQAPQPPPPVTTPRASVPRPANKPAPPPEPEPEAPAPSFAVDEASGLVVPSSPAAFARRPTKVGSRFDRRFDYDRVAGALGDPAFINAVEDYTVNMKNGQRAYKGGAEDDAWWAQATGGPPRMGKHFGGLELAETERGGGLHPDKPEPKKGPVSQVTLTASRGLPPPTKQELAESRLIARLHIDGPTITGDAGLDKIELKKYARKRSGPWRACYEKALAKDPELAGIMQFQVHFDETGKATLARVNWSTLSIGKIEDCLAKASVGWRFTPIMPKETKAVFELQFESHTH